MIKLPTEPTRSLVPGVAVQHPDVISKITLKTGNSNRTLEPSLDTADYAKLQRQAPVIGKLGADTREHPDGEEPSARAAPACRDKLPFLELESRFQSLNTLGHALFSFSSRVTSRTP